MAGIYLRGKTYWARAQRNGHDHRKSLKTNSRSLAEKRFRDWQDEMDALAWGDKPRPTFDRAMEHFITNHLPNLKESSARRYMTSARQMIDHFEGLYLDQISRKELNKYVEARKDGNATAPTIRRDLACLSSMFSEADIEWEGVANPVPSFLKERQRRGNLRESPPRTRYLSRQEEIQLIQAATGDLADQIQFAIDTGLRLEELMSLTWDRIKLDRNEILITETKSGKPRIVPLEERASRILRSLPRHIRRFDGKDWVFCKRDGSRYSQRTRGFKAAANRAGIRDIRWHDLRRTCGCRLLQERELPLEYIRDWLGHSTVAQTERAYAFLRTDDLHKALAKARTKAGT